MPAAANSCSEAARLSQAAERGVGVAGGELPEFVEHRPERRREALYGSVAERMGDERDQSVVLRELDNPLCIQRVLKNGADFVSVVLTERKAGAGEHKGEFG